MDNERSGIRNRLRQTQESRMYSIFILNDVLGVSIKKLILIGMIWK